MKVKVAISGYGTIGKRVADAIKLQPDMELVGIAKTKPDYFAFLAYKSNIDVFAVDGSEKNFEDANFPYKGSLSELLSKADIVIDTSPGGMGKNNKTLYEKQGLKMIFQGGEDADIAEVSFVAQVNYNSALGKNVVRVVSCNTTGLARIIYPLHENFKIKEAKVILIRRAADPKETKKGPINCIKPDFRIPSHHAFDLKTIIPDIDIVSIAYVVPTTLMHVHTLMVKLSRNVTQDDIISILKENPRTLVVSKSMGFSDTAQLIEFARDLGRKRNDLYEVAVWEESIFADGAWVYLIYAVHQEAIVVPENIDAVRSMFELKSQEESMKITDNSLGIGNIFFK